MERAVALKKLRKILGDKLGYRVDPDAPRQSQRDEAQRKLREEIPARKALGDAMDARKKAILDADPEYQKLKADYAAADKRCGSLTAITCRYKFTVGTTGELFFHVKAQGDSWEEVIGKLTKAPVR